MARDNVIPIRGAVVEAEAERAERMDEDIRPTRQTFGDLAYFAQKSELSRNAKAVLISICSLVDFETWRKQFPTWWIAERSDLSEDSVARVLPGLISAGLITREETVRGTSPVWTVNAGAVMALPTKPLKRADPPHRAVNPPQPAAPSDVSTPPQPAATPTQFAVNPPQPAVNPPHLAAPYHGLNPQSSTTVLNHSTKPPPTPPPGDGDVVGSRQRDEFPKVLACRTDSAMVHKIWTTIAKDRRSLLPDVVVVWDSYRAQFPNRRVLDIKAARKLVDRLEEGFTPDELCRVPKMVTKSAFHMGDNPGKKLYIDIETIYRDRRAVEEHLARGNAPVAGAGTWQPTNGLRHPAEGRNRTAPTMTRSEYLALCEDSMLPPDEYELAQLTD